MSASSLFLTWQLDRRRAGEPSPVPTPPPAQASQNTSFVFTAMTTVRRASQPQASPPGRAARPPDALMTQVDREAPGAAASAVTWKTLNRDDPAFRDRLKRVQSQAKNLSPMNPAKYAPLLRKSLPGMTGRKTLLLDVDETLVHSTYKPPPVHDLHLECMQGTTVCHIYVSYRPKLFEFLRTVKDWFELVIFTASVEVYCNPLMDRIDPTGELGLQLRLFRDHCSTVNGSYVKDLSLLGRPMDQMAIIDNSPVAYLFQPRNAIPIISWFDDPKDEELIKMLPMLRDLAAAPDVYAVLDPYNAMLPPATGK